MRQEVYSSWYNWSDLDVLETVLHSCYGSDFSVVEVAAGPNIAVPYVLKSVALPFRYVSLDIEKAHIQLQKEGVGTVNVQGVVGDANYLPVRDECVDVFIFHHAIDDILETRGFEGLWTSIDEALTAVKEGGCMIFSHCVFSYDPYTKKIDLSAVQSFLERRVKGRFQRICGSRQNWLIVRDISRCDGKNMSKKSNL